MRLSRHVEDAYVLDDVETDTWLRRKLSEAWSSCSWTCSGSRTHTNSGDDAVPQLNTKLRRGSGSSSARALRGSYPEQHVRRGSVGGTPDRVGFCVVREQPYRLGEARCDRGGPKHLRRLHGVAEDAVLEVHQRKELAAEVVRCCDTKTSAIEQGRNPWRTCGAGMRARVRVGARRR